jgi:hypothetical protein
MLGILVRKVALPRAAISVRGGRPPRLPRSLLLDHEHGGLYGAGAIWILLNEHVVGDGPTVFEHACRLGAEGIVSKKVDGTYRSGPCSVWIKVRNLPAWLYSGSAARSGIGDSRSLGDSSDIRRWK